MTEIKPIEYWLNKIHCGDAYELLKQIPSESVDCVITSPPFYALRTYGKYTEKIFDGDPNCSHEWNGSLCVKCNAYKGELGLEPSWELYVRHLVDLFREVKRVLKKTGSFWLNIGDTYASKSMNWTEEYANKPQWHSKEPILRGISGYKPKCLMLIPFRVAFALIDDGWILRNVIIWKKLNPIPSSVKDRMAQTYEYVLHFVKSRKYYYCLDNIRIPHKTKFAPFNLRVRDVKQLSEITGIKETTLAHYFRTDFSGQALPDRETWNLLKPILNLGNYDDYISEEIRSALPQTHPLGRNPGDVWEMSTRPLKEMHFASFPLELPLRPILATCPPDNGIVLDPLAGCYDKETEVLTKKGWKHFKDVTFDDEIATLNPITKELEYQRPIRIINYHYKGKMYYVKTKKVDLNVTPDHNVYVAMRKYPLPKKEWKFAFYKPSEIFGKYVIYSKSFIWKGREKEYVLLEGCSSKNQQKYHPVQIPIDLFLQFLGYYLSEGSVPSGQKDYRIQISTDMKDKYRNKMVEVAKKLASILGRKIFQDKRGRIIIFDKRLYYFLKRLGYANTKYIPREFLELPRDKLHILLESLIEGDGHKKGSKMEYYTVSKQLADDVQELALKCGYDATVSIRKPKYVRIGDRLIYSKQSYIVHISKRSLNPRVYIKRNLLDGKRKGYSSKCVEEWIDYDGMVYCVEVPNHVILIRRNGKVVWCGNSGTVALTCELINHGKWDEFRLYVNEIAKKQKWNIKWIMIEMNPEYCKIAEKRLAPFLHKTLEEYMGN